MAQRAFRSRVLLIYRSFIHSRSSGVAVFHFVVVDVRRFFLVAGCDWNRKSEQWDAVTAAAAMRRSTVIDRFAVVCDAVGNGAVSSLLVTPPTDSWRDCERANARIVYVEMSLLLRVRCAIVTKLSIMRDAQLNVNVPRPPTTARLSIDETTRALYQVRHVARPLYPKICITWPGHNAAVPPIIGPCVWYF